MNFAFKNQKTSQSPAYKPKLINHILDSSSDQSDISCQDEQLQYQEKKYIKEAYEIPEKNQNKSIGLNERRNCLFDTSSNNRNKIHYQSFKLSQYQNYEEVQKKRENKCQYKRAELQNVQSISSFQQKSKFCSDSLDPVKSSQRQKYKQKQSKQKIQYEKQWRESDIQKYQKKINEFQYQIQSLKGQLKRSNDVIRTLTLKNTDLQKNIQMKNIHINELNSLSNRQKQFSSKNNFYENRLRENVNQCYANCLKYIVLKIDQLQKNINGIKMNPMLNQKLNSFFQELCLINEITVIKTINTQIMQNKVPKQHLKQSNNVNNINFQAITPIKNSIKVKNQQNIHTPINLINGTKSQLLSKSTSHNNLMKKTQFEIKTINLRQNAHLNKYIDQKSRMSSNPKQQLKLLQKSLNKLRQMDKQNTPNNNQTGNWLNNHFTSTKSEFERSEYSIIGLNKSQISNMDKSRSKRKKIFN